MTPAELDAACRTLRPACLRWARGAGIPRREVEDVANAALEALVRQRDRVPAAGAVAYLRTAIAIQARVAWRGLRAEPCDVPEIVAEETAEDTLVSAQLSEAVREALARVPASRREIVVQVIGEERPIADVAREQDMPESTVRLRVATALEDVRADLERRGAAEQRKSGFRSWCVGIVALLDPRALWRRIQIVRAATAVALGATGAVIAAMGGEPPHISPTPDEPLVRAVEVDTLRPITPLPAAERGRDAPAAPARPRARHDAGRHFAAVRFSR